MRHTYINQDSEKIFQALADVTNVTEDMYLLNSLPARLLAQGEGSRFVIDVLSKQEVIDLCNRVRVYSAIGHQPAAERLSRELGFIVPTNRITLEHIPNGGVLIANIVTPKRCAEGSPGYTEAEQMQMPINWIMVRNA